MLQSEFFERTHITLTADEYADVECLYNAVKMDKDEFCKNWVSERENPLFKELAEAYCHEYRMHLADVNQLQATCESLHKDFDQLKAGRDAEIDNIINVHNNAHNEFAKRIIRANCEGDLRVEDVIEEEFGIGFIIRTKREAGIPLSDSEIDYMVSKL